LRVTEPEAAQRRGRNHEIADDPDLWQLFRREKEVDEPVEAVQEDADDERQAGLTKRAGEVLLLKLALQILVVESQRDRMHVHIDIGIWRVVVAQPFLAQHLYRIRDWAWAGRGL